MENDHLFYHFHVYYLGWSYKIKGILMTAERNIKIPHSYLTCYSISIGCLSGIFFNQIEGFFYYSPMHSSALPNHSTFIFKILGKTKKTTVRFV